MHMMETEDLIQARSGEDGRSDTCTCHHTRINSQQKIGGSTLSNKKRVADGVGGGGGIPTAVSD